MQGRDSEAQYSTYLVGAMWKTAPVVVLLALCWAATPVQPAEMGEEPDICTLTETLMAMKEVIFSLTSEISDLRLQVKASCQASDTADVGMSVTGTPPKKSDMDTGKLDAA